MKRDVVVIVGLQYGSEGKGQVAGSLADWTDVAVRTGGPNAGHTVYHNNQALQLRHVPCAVVNPNALLVMGPGALVDPEVLMEEIRMLGRMGLDVSGRFFIHKAAGVIRSHHKKSEAGIAQSIGSTQEGVGACRISRIMRDDSFRRFGDMTHWAAISDALYLRLVNGGGRVVLEGTQGAGLSLIHGLWPYCTSHDTTAGTIVADAGLSPRDVTHILGVLRTYPIRVAGNSGPMEHETTWEVLGVQPEHTTVTKKTRRVGEFEWKQLLKAVTINKPNGLAVSFLDYLWPKNGVEDDGEKRWREFQFLWQLKCMLGVDVYYGGTGPGQYKELWNEYLERGREGA